MTPLAYTVHYCICMLVRSEREVRGAGPGEQSSRSPQTHSHTPALLLMSCVTLGRWTPSLCSFFPNPQNGEYDRSQSCERVECQCKSVARHLKGRPQSGSNPSSSSFQWGHLGQVPPSVPQFPHLEVIRCCWWNPREAWHTLGAQWTLVTSGHFRQSAQATADVHNRKFSWSDAQSVCQPVSGQAPTTSQLGCTDPGVAAE